MRLDAPGRPHLTYCTNIHPGETWSEVRDNLERRVVAVRKRVAGKQPFGLGLRLSQRAARELVGDPSAFEQLAELLERHALYVFTLNGFPFGRFHGARVKEKVYRPDWLEEERLTYSEDLARLLSRLLPDDGAGSVSTVPGAFRPRVPTATEQERIAERILAHAERLHHIADETGRSIVLALEPEPCCLLETIEETVRFFERRLLAGEAFHRFASRAGLPHERADAIVRRHVGVCLDTCHAAVEYEAPQECLERLGRAGLQVAKIQLSAGLRVPRLTAEMAVALHSFAEDVYLHQVVERSPDGLRRFTDLPEALAAARDTPADAASSPPEWRIHFHVPIFLRHLGVPGFETTQPFLEEILAQARERCVSPHLEVETYSWDVLPERYRRDPVEAAVAREIDWVRERLAA